MDAHKGRYILYRTTHHRSRGGLHIGYDVVIYVLTPSYPHDLRNTYQCLVHSRTDISPDSEEYAHILSWAKCMDRSGCKYE